MISTSGMVAVLSLLAPSTLLAATATTVRVTISGPDLVSPIQITEDVGRFRVWDGPSTTPSSAAQSLIVDWATGPVEPSKSQPVYTLSFETTRQNPSTYIVLYTFDSASDKGYVYIPGSQHPAYKDNTWLIAHLVEGNWFRAQAELDRLVNPLLVRAPKVR